MWHKQRVSPPRVGYNRSDLIRYELKLTHYLVDRLANVATLRQTEQMLVAGAGREKNDTLGVIRGRIIGTRRSAAT